MRQPSGTNLFQHPLLPLKPRHLTFFDEFEYEATTVSSQPALLPIHVPTISAMPSEAEAQVQLKDFKNIFSLEGKVVVVTGGSRGLGLHAASGYVTPRSFTNQIPSLSMHSL